MESDEQPKNRRARRAADKSDPSEGSAIKDRNLRLRAEAAAGRKNRRDNLSRASAEGLDASEKFDDVFLRSTDAAGKFFSRYATALQSLIVIAAAAGMGYLIWDYRSDADNAKLGDRVASVLDAASGRLTSDTAPKKTEFGLTDTRPEFADAAAKQKAVLEKWRSLETGTPDTIRLWGVLGEAGTLLDSRDYAEARKKYESLTSAEMPLIKARAYEGLVLAWEGEGALDSALSAAQKLAEVPGQSDLGKYHEARLSFAKGDRDKAVQLTNELKEKLAKGARPFEARPYLLGAVEDFDKTLNPRPASAPGQTLSPEAMEMLKKQLEDLQKRQGQEEPSAPVPLDAGPLDAGPLAPGPLAPAEPAPELPPAEPSSKP